MTRLNRAQVEHEIFEMWHALGGLPDRLRDEGYDRAVTEAHATEARLRQELDTQDRLDEAAPALLALARRVATHWEGTDAPLGETARALLAKVEKGA